MKTSPKYFPIKTATACQAKWNWSTLYLVEGTTASCHRTGWSQIDPDNFENFHNTEIKIQDRQAMLQSQWPSNSCAYCKDIEEQGGHSDRFRHLSIPNMSPPELDSDTNATRVSPTILEVYFDNTCNLACLYCIPSLSSKINQENQQFGDFNSLGVNLVAVSKNPHHNVLVEKFWLWMHSNSHQLKRLHVLGGEALYQKQFYELLNWIDQNPRPGLELNLITNLMVDASKLTSVIQKLKTLLLQKKLARVDFTCSIDCWGHQQEYVRWGMDLVLWQKNFEYLLTHKWLTININQTISVLTIKTMPQLLEKLQQWRQQHKVGQFFSQVEPQPAYMRAGILGPGRFVDDFDKIIKLMPDDTEQNKSARAYMQGISAAINDSPVDTGHKQNLRIFLDEKDRRRQTSWQKTFPWLVKELCDVVQ